mgnify:CR=1 FL=1
MKLEKNNQETNLIVEQGMEKIKTLFNRILGIKEHATGATFAKNPERRSYHLIKIEEEIKKVEEENRSWNNVTVAKIKGEDVHSGSLKSDKLEIVSGRYHDFGQAIVDKKRNSNDK